MQPREKISVAFYCQSRYIRDIKGPSSPWLRSPRVLPLLNLLPDVQASVSRIMLRDEPWVTRCQVGVLVFRDAASLTLISR